MATAPVTRRTRPPAARHAPCSARSAAAPRRRSTAYGSRASRPPPADAGCAPSRSASRLEAVLGLAARTLRVEVQVETPQAILGPDGTALVARMVHAAAGRCTG